MRCRACGTSVDEPGSMPLCPACAAVNGNPRDPGRFAPTSALWLWMSPHTAAALATGDLGVMIRAWRQATGTSQLALADRLGYDPSYIAMIETGRRDVVDIVNRRRIAQHLGIPLHRVGVTDTDATDHVTMLQFGCSTLRLATIARHAGHGAAAVNELWPLVARLEARAADAILDKDTLLLLARARAELGVSLGYVLPEERLAFAVRWTGRALRVARHLDDTDLQPMPCARTATSYARRDAPGRPWSARSRRRDRRSEPAATSARPARPSRPGPGDVRRHAHRAAS
jgi:transcriptional regulator with XRE-family HTH domain